MSIAFWSREVKAGSEIEASVPEGYVLNLQNAALNPEENKDGTYLVVKIKTLDIEGDDISATIGTLRPKLNEQINTAIGKIFIPYNIINTNTNTNTSNWL